MLSRRRRLLNLVPPLVGLVLGLDLLWHALAGSGDSPAFGLVDEPAHLATCALALVILAAARRERLPAAFVAAALLASVAIDLDHLPGYAGWDGLSAGAPRPYSHSPAVAVAALLLAAAWGRPAGRWICLGVAFGIAAHLLRDVATGPGVPMLWPLSGGVVRLPYAGYAIGLGLAAIATAFMRRLPAGVRARPRVALGAFLLPIAALPAIAASPAEAYRVSIGGYLPGGDNDPSLIHDLGNQIGRRPAIILSYKSWEQAPFVYDQLDGIWDRGAIPVVTWELWDSRGEGVSLWGIATGHHDGYLRDAARAAAGWQRPLMVRVGQEMNAGWFPWGRQPAAFRAAWRRIVRVFRAEGADNVRWVWTPYVNSGEMPFRRYYPGGRFVDWVGLDGINWGGPFAWRSFGEVFNKSYRALVRLTPKPVMLAETGSGESGGHKARWLTSMLRRVVPRMRHVRAISFWSVEDSRGDLRVDSSARALGALQAALRMPLYRSSREAVLQTPPVLGKKHGKRGRRSTGKG